MRKLNYQAVLILIGVLLMTVILFALVTEALQNSAPPSVPPLETVDQSTNIQGEIRTDTMICFQRENQPKFLLNLSYQNSENWFDEYPAEFFEEYDIRPGDFVQAEYQAKYSVGGIDGHHQEILQVGDFHQVFAKEALANRNLPSVQDIWHNSRTANAYPVQINQNSVSDFVMIPAENCYYLFFPDSDKPLIFDEYKQITKTITVHDTPIELHMWVLCNETISDQDMLDALYSGTVSQTPEMFFVGYDAPYPFSFTADGIEQESIFSMKKIYIPEGVPREYARHFLPEELENTEVFSTLPTAVQQELVSGWNHEDHVLLFGGQYDETSVLTFNNDNRLCLLNGNNSGYVVIYLEPEFFDTICSGIEKE